MARTVKQPDERRQELLDTAMRLFVERGVEEVSIRDIADAADVTPGLIYHYFDSKTDLFNEVLDSYASQCAEVDIQILDNPSLAFSEKIDALLDAIAQEEHRPYHEFFHKSGNRAFHDQLSRRMCDLIRPHLAQALIVEAYRRGATLRSAETLADFITHGLINVLSDPDTPDPQVLEHVREYIDALLESQMVVDGEAASEAAVPARGDDDPGGGEGAGPS